MRPSPAAGYGAAAVVLAWLAAAAFNTPWIGALAQPAVAKALAADAFLAAGLIVIVAAPLAGVACASRPWPLVVAVGTFAGLSCGAAAAVALHTGYPAALVVRSHVVLAAVAFALAGLGVAASSLMRSRLDAAGTALLIALVATAAILAGGPRTAQLSESTIDYALLANPLVAVTSAAELDVLRSGLLYALAPVSHRRFTYPAWTLTLSTYGTLAACCLTLAFLRSRQKGPIA